ncbi:MULTISPECIES: hypothetical protein [Arthrobacter]|uniref:Uncharacterized protein n=1 Tax=Arthrobacter terricola TaxID=2547396 RepID=A0A4R5L1B0_9MICC|nr:MULTISPECIES: hypothetical protein [Arthrobacter]MBT8159561.1 hypothetical protein [Arthrobacter sp. GN70]TDG01318.1 hypothetical protein E1809_02025 [Arthrobacter terricola]
MPTNILRDWLRTRRGLRWGILAMLLAARCFNLTSILTARNDDVASELLCVLAVMCIWNGVKMLWIGPLTLTLLI